MFKRFSYILVWSLAQISRYGFYSKIRYRNKERSKLEHPTILVVNHPNTLFDPFMAAIPVNRGVHFLANAGLFKVPFLGWFLGSTYGIKVERKEDNAGSGKKLQNDGMFRFAEDFLANGGCLFIAPEGGSDIQRRIRKFKTGTARISLGTEAKNNFEVGLELLPIGLNYTDQTKFKSEVFVNMGEPIRVADFKAQYEADSFEAAVALTEEMQNRIKQLTIDTKDDEEDALVRKLEEIAQTENPLPFNLSFDRTKKIIEAWRNLQEQSSQQATALSQNVEEYFSFLNGEEKNLQKNKIRDYIVTKTQASNATLAWVGRTIFMILGFPIFLYGYLNNFIPNYLPWLLKQKMNIHPAYSSAIMGLSGLLIYPIFYGLQIWLVNRFFEPTWVPWAYLVSLYITGKFAWWYKDFAKDTMSGWRLLSFYKNEKSTITEILETRKSIVTDLDLLLR